MRQPPIHFTTHVREDTAADLEDLYATCEVLCRHMLVQGALISEIIGHSDGPYTQAGYSRPAQVAIIDGRIQQL